MTAKNRLRYIRNLLLFTVTLLLVAVYLVLPVIMASRALHPHRYPIGEFTPADLGLAYEDVQFNSADGLSIHGWYMPASEPNGATVIALHAFNGNRTGVIHHAELLANHGYGVLAIDLRAHGDSEGDNFSFGWSADQDVFAALDYLQARPEIDSHHIGILGLSIGAEVALQAAAHDERIQAVVAEGAGYHTFEEFLIEPGLSGWLLLPGDWVFFKSGEILGGVPSPPPLTELAPQIAPRPVMLIAAGDDRPFNRAYYELAKEPKQFWERPEPGHIDALFSHPEQYEEDVIAFLDEALLSQSEVQPEGAQVPDWQTAAPGEVGIDLAPLKEMAAHIHDGDYQNVHAVLIARNGKLVFEEYFDGYTWDYFGEDFRGELVQYNAETPHNLASVTKSFTSALVGLALEKGQIQSLQTAVFDYFPEYEDLASPQKERINLEHLLTMTSGLEWNGMEVPLSDPNNDLVRLFDTPDPIAYILSKPAIHEAGERWYYSGGDTNLLGEVIKKATGQRLDEYSAKLFDPLGIEDYEWDFINQDVVHASGNLKLRPRDMAKFGYLFLNGGKWQGQQILSPQWVARSAKAYIPAPNANYQGYGYQWWFKEFPYQGGQIQAQYAAGWGGQYIYLFPELDLIVVFTGGNYASYDPIDDMIKLHILPAVE